MAYLKAAIFFFFRDQVQPKWGNLSKKNRVQGRPKYRRLPKIGTYNNSLKIALKFKQFSLAEINSMSGRHYKKGRKRIY